MSPPECTNERYVLEHEADKLLGNFFLHHEKMTNTLRRYYGAGYYRKRDPLHC